MLFVSFWWLISKQSDDLLKSQLSGKLNCFYFWNVQFLETRKGEGMTNFDVSNLDMMIMIHIK